MSTFRLAGFAGLLVLAAVVGGTIIGSVAAASGPGETGPSPLVAAPGPGGGAGGAVGATRAQYCADFRRAFAAELGVDETALAPAARRAAITTIDAAVAAGRMPKAAGDRLKARMEQAGADGCALLAGRPGSVNAPSARPAARGLGIVKDGLAAAANALGISPAEVGAALRTGKTLKDVATAKGIPYPTVSAAAVAAVKADLDAAVAAGTIKQAREDRVLQRLERNLADGRLGNGRPGAPAGRLGSPAPSSGS